MRAEVIQQLLTSDPRLSSGRARAVSVQGARITGNLDLLGFELRCALRLVHCYCDRPVVLDDAVGTRVQLTGCQMPLLAANRVRLSNFLLFDQGFAAGGVQLAGARIDGFLDMSSSLFGVPGPSRATADNGTSFAVFGDNLSVAGNCHFASAQIMGGMRLAGATVGGQLSLSGASLSRPGDVALHAGWLTVDDLMTCRGTRVAGEMRLVGARIRGQLLLIDAKLDPHPGEGSRAGIPCNPFVGTAMSVGDDVVAERLHAVGSVLMSGSRIGGQLTFENATLEGGRGPALVADGLAMEQPVFFDGAKVSGEVSLVGARVRRLSLAGASLLNEGRTALDGEGIVADEVRFEPLLRSREVKGEGDPARSKAKSDQPRSVPWVEPAEVSGEIRLRRANIANDISFVGTEMEHATLDLQLARLGALVMHPAHRPRSVDLRGSRVVWLADTPEDASEGVYLTGLQYERLAQHDVSVRLKWLRHAKDGYSPDAYDELARAYRRAGEPEHANRVGIAKQRHRRRVLAQGHRRGVLALPGEAASLFLDATVGYGYRKWLAGLWLVLLWAVGWAIFASAHPRYMQPLHPPGQTPRFQAAIYSLDALVPLIDLGQRSAWQPIGAARWWFWFSICAGWALTTAVAAALAGLLRTD